MLCSEALISRGLISNMTDSKVLEALDSQSVVFYIGFDPTANSLHVGHLLTLTLISLLKSYGHRPIILLGSATSLVGDPTGKTDMRKMLNADEISHNAEAFKSMMTKIVGDVIFEDNLNWFGGMKYVEFLRDVGVHFSVNKMLTAECYHSRLEKGLTFLEFNYMLMQSYDFVKLNEAYNCTLQIGGSDQWANITAGVDLIRRINARSEATPAPAPVYGLTVPLLTNAAGLKMGKTESGAIWLDANKTTPLEFFQYFRNLPDQDVGNVLKMLVGLNVLDFTDINLAKEMLAFEVTGLVHGKEVSAKILSSLKKQFEGDFDSLKENILTKNDLVSVLLELGIADSSSKAKILIKQGAIKVNDKIETEVSRKLIGTNIICKSKKTFFKVTIKEN